MNGGELIRVVDLMHRERNIAREVIFGAIEKAIRLAITKSFEDEENIEVAIDRHSGEIVAKKGEQIITPEELGRISAQAAKQAMIQILREEESTSVFNEYAAQKGDLVHGTVGRFEGGAATVSLGKAEALLPRGEQIPGESHHVGERVKAIILEVKRSGHRVRIILSRTHPDFVRRLFENEIPEIHDHTIEIRAVAREAGYRTKVAVSSIDMKVDCVGACVGVRGSRIKNIVEELGGERIDIVRWNDSLQVLIPNALQPAAVEEVFLYGRLGRAIVLVKEDQLSLAIGRRGQNVRLASKLVGWDIEIMTHDELNEGIERAEGWFLQVPGVTPEMVEAFIEEGFLSYADLTFMEPSQLAEVAGVTEDAAEEMIAYAEEAAEIVEEQEREQKALEASQPHQPAQSPAQKAAAKLFSEPLPTPVVEAKPTFESLFKPDEPAEQPAAMPEATVGEEGAATAVEEPPAAEPATAPAPEAEMASTEAAPGGEPVTPATNE